MSGRKKATPKKLNETTCFDLSWNMNESLNESSMNTSSTSNSNPLAGHGYTRKKIRFDTAQNQLILGSISLGLKSVLKINSCEIRKMTIKYKLDEGHIVIVEINSRMDRDYIQVPAEIPQNLESFFTTIFSHSFNWVYQPSNEEFCQDFKFDVTTVYTKFPIFNTTLMMEYFFNKDYSEYSNCMDHSREVHPEEVFKEIKQHQLTFYDNKYEKNYEKLIPTIRPYQVDAIHWMVTREQKLMTEVKVQWLDSIYDKLITVNNKEFYFHKYSGVIVTEPDSNVYFPSGGILSDEMGLGKTVEVVACILNNPRNIEAENNEDYIISPKLNRTLVESGKKMKSEVKLSGGSKKKRRKRRKSYEDEDIRDRIHARIPREKGCVRKVLNEWYDKILSGYSTVKTNNECDESDHVSRCTCGEDVDIDEEYEEGEDYVQCNECETYQHPKCVNYVDNFCYYCPQCWGKQKKIKSGGTLIIAPSAICDQWVDEINKHFKQDQLNILVYKGVKSCFIQPSVLAAYDIVITNYNTFKAEIHHATENQTRTFRRQEKFLKVTVSPLTQINWWRFCLDEAQMVESNVSNTNQMAKLVDAVHRWSVTGTPIQKSINDLFYLVEFLRIEPFSVANLWHSCMYLPYMKDNKLPMLCVLSQVFWRNSKFEVHDEIQLPQQSFKFHMLNFNAIEEHFYMRIHKQKSEQFLENVQKLKFAFNRSLKSLDKQSLTSLLAPMLHLRQACSHPQAIRGVFTKKGCMTKEELLEYLINKTKVESEDAVRRYIAAENGLAGVYSIKEEWALSVERYRNVLQFAEEYKDKILVDSLQRIHALNNLAEVLEHHSEGIPPTLRDCSLRTEASVLEKKYMTKKLEDLEQSRAQLKTLSKKVLSLNKQIRSTTAWWIRALQVVDDECDELVEKIQNDISDHFEDTKNPSNFFLNKISSIVSIDAMLRRWLQGIESERTSVVNHLEFIRELTDEMLVTRAVECHLRPSYETQRLQKCELCTGEKKLLNYECQLFDTAMKKHKSYEKVMDGIQTKGSWRSNKCEIMLKSILSFVKSRIVSKNDSWCVSEGSAHISMLETMKKEFKQLRAVWMELNHRIQAEDELAMSKLKLRLLRPGELLPKNQSTNLSLKQHDKLSTIHIISPHEVDLQLVKLHSEARTTVSEFRKKYGTLVYLQNLGKKENSKPDPCPVCRCELSEQWCVLQCGHSYCLECIHGIGLKEEKTSFKCPICREVTNNKDVCFIDLSTRNEANLTPVLGSHSTKVEYIVRAILDIKKEDEEAKFVIFSTWTKVLDFLAGALTENSVTFTRMPGYKYQEQLKRFKEKPDVAVMLLPVSYGSKGLNLTEANHLFLIEPITNPADELQAIGRIHRIGQTRATTVHRFLIKGTIEEKIQSAVSAANDKWEENKVTIQDLLNLFAFKEETSFQTNDMY